MVFVTGEYATHLPSGEKNGPGKEFAAAGISLIGFHSQDGRDSSEGMATETPKHRSEVLFPTLRGDQLSPDSVSDLLAKHVAVARKSCPLLGNKRVSPHVLRHSMAMGLLQAGVDRAVIALCWVTNRWKPRRSILKRTSQ